MAKDIMAHHGQKFNAYYGVVMPDTWTPVFDLTDKNRVDKWLSDGKKQLELVIDNNVKCVLDVFTDVRNLQSVMATKKRTSMGSIKIRTQEFRKYMFYHNP